MRTMIFKQPFLRNKQLAFIIYAPGTYRTANVCLLFHFLDQTSHDTFGILILGTHCVLKIRPRDTLGPSIKIICLAIIQTSHDTCQPIPYRTVQYRTDTCTVPYGTVPYRSNSVRSTEIYVPSGNH